ncbi:sugar phosphate nucleotidyltransferase [Thalassolituus sp. LLYu03]|uniref:sugar phosphate nucleotidyltransferase n=1 Tax=Thalassolituus sp. LLYu03 TaxID=3421656 RepID=UPI003D286DE9
MIRDIEAFQLAAMQLRPAVQASKFGTLDIVPTEAASGYGYINVGSAESDALLAVERFGEKPDQGTAQQYFTEKSTRVQTIGCGTAACL